VTASASVAAEANADETKGPGLARTAAAITALTAVSRATGLVRNVVVVFVLGYSVLGDTYSASNNVPNILFELVAAGTLQAVLIPSLVRSIDQGKKEDAERLAASVLGLTLVALGTLAIVGIALAPVIARGIFSGADPARRADQVRLGTVFLLIFLPQVAMYAVGMVGTGILNAHDRFLIPAIAPAVNNVIVCTAYGLFFLSRHGAGPSLDLTATQVALLAGGTTLGVVGFSALPILAARRTGFRIRVAFDRHDPELRRVLRMGAWAAGFLATTQLLTLTEIILSGKVKGGVVALALGWTLFLLPFALFAQPIFTALFPTLSRQLHRGDHAGFARSTETGAELIALFVIPVAIALAATAPALARGLSLGPTAAAGSANLARVLVGFAPGIIGYGLLGFFARVLYARDDARTPTIVNLAAGITGVVAMVVVSGVVPERWLVGALAACEATAYVASATVLAVIITRRSAVGHRPALATRLRPHLIAAVPVAVIGILIGRQIPLQPRALALGGSALVGLGILAVFTLATGAFGGPSPRTLVATLRGGGGTS
jgi:putative peptidoglycan lipid II flippase